MQRGALLEGGTERPVQSLLEVEVAFPLHDMSEEVAVEGGVLGEQVGQVEGALGGDELSQAHLAWRDGGPITGGHQTVVGVRTVLADALEDHRSSLRRGLSPAMSRAN